MKIMHKSLLSAAIIAATTVMSAEAATDAERIRMLEDQLRQQKTMMEQQQRMLEAMDAELKRLKAGEPVQPAEAVIAETPVMELQAEQLPAVVTADELHDEQALSMNIYGFVMADAIYDFKRVDPNWDDTLRVTTIPTESGTYGEDGDFVFGVRQSRLGVKGNYGEDITFILEAELFGVGGDEGQTTPRLRHAWGTYKNFGMGQYWSNFMDIDIFPNTIDYWGPTGMVFYRNQQARYTFPMGEDEFSISIEDPGNNGDFGHYQIAGMLRKLGYERVDTGQKDDELGWGINTSAGINTWGRDLLKLQVVYGEGIGNYMNDGGIDIAPDSSDINNAGADTVELLGISAYYDHYWSDKWSTSVGWSMTDLDTTAGQLGTEFEKGQIAQINLLHYPADNVLLGSEFIWGEREDVNGNTGSDYRIQFTLKVNFE